MVKISEMTQAQYSAYLKRLAKNRKGGRSAVAQASYDRRASLAKLKRRDAREARVSRVMPIAMQRFKLDYNASNFKGNPLFGGPEGTRDRVLRRDQMYAGPYARSLASYNPRRNDWPGVDDLGIDGKAAIPWAQRKKRSVQPMNPDRRAAFLAMVAARSAIARSQHGGYSGKELMAIAKAQQLPGRSKMSTTELWYALGQPGSRGRELSRDAMAVYADSGPSAKRRMVKFEDYDQ